MAPASRKPRVQEAAQAVGRAPGHQVVEAVDGVGGQGRVFGPALPGQVHEANQGFGGLGRQPGLAGFQVGQDGFELSLGVFVGQITGRQMDLEAVAFGVRFFQGRIHRGHDLVGHDFPATPDFGLGCAPQDFEPGSGPAAGAGTGLNHPDVVGEDHIPGIGVGQGTEEFQEAGVPGGAKAEVGFISHQDLGIGRDVFEALGAVGVVQSHLLGEAVDVDDSAFRDLQEGGDVGVELLLGDLLGFQLFPAPDVDDLGARGEFEPVAGLGQGAEDRVVEDKGEAEDHQGLVRGLKAVQEFLRLEDQGRVLVRRLNEEFKSRGKVEVALDGGGAGPGGFPSRACGVHVHDEEGAPLGSQDLLHHPDHGPGLAFGRDSVHGDGGRYPRGGRGLELGEDLFPGNRGQLRAKGLENGDGDGRDLGQISIKDVRVKIVLFAEFGKEGVLVPVVGQGGQEIGSEQRALGGLVQFVGSGVQHRCQGRVYSHGDNTSSMRAGVISTGLTRAEASSRAP